MATTTRRPTPAQARKAAVESDYTPLYAAAGLTDLVAESIKNVVLSTQEKATKRFTELQSSFAELQSKGNEQAKSASGFVKGLPEQVKALPETTKARLADLEQQRKEFLSEATTTYADLAGRGKKVIDDSLIAARKTTADVEEKVDEAREDLGDAVDPVFEAVQEGVTKARKTVSGRTATETVTPRSAAKATATREAPSAKRSAAAQKAAATRKANAAKKAAAAS